MTQQHRADGIADRMVLFARQSQLQRRARLRAQIAKLKRALAELEKQLAAVEAKIPNA